MIKDYREIREVVMQYVNGCAAGDVELAKEIARTCHNPYFRPYVSTDVVGTENCRPEASKISMPPSDSSEPMPGRKPKWTSWKRSARLRRCVSCWRTGMGCRSPIFIRW